MVEACRRPPRHAVSRGVAETALTCWGGALRHAESAPVPAVRILQTAWATATWSSVPPPREPRRERRYVRVLTARRVAPPLPPGLPRHPPRVIHIGWARLAQAPLAAAGAPAPVAVRRDGRGDGLCSAFLPRTEPRESHRRIADPSLPIHLPRPHLRHALCGQYWRGCARRGVIEMEKIANGLRSSSLPCFRTCRITSSRSFRRFSAPSSMVSRCSRSHTLIQAFSISISIAGFGT